MQINISNAYKNIYPQDGFYIYAPTAWPGRVGQIIFQSTSLLKQSQQRMKEIGWGRPRVEVESGKENELGFRDLGES